MKKRRRYIVAIVLLAILILLLGHMTVGWMRTYLYSLERRIEQSKLALKTIDDECNINTKYKNKWKEISGFQNEALEDRQTQFTAYLQKLEADRDFDFGQMTPSERPLKETKEFQELSYKLVFSANLKDLAMFLARLDESDKLLRIDSLNISCKIIPQYDRYRMPLLSTADLQVELTVTIPAALGSSDSSKKEFAK
jgi:hypothetical protein